MKQERSPLPNSPPPQGAKNDQPCHTFLLEEKLRQQRFGNANPHADANELQSRRLHGTSALLSNGSEG